MLLLNGQGDSFPLDWIDATLPGSYLKFGQAGHEYVVCLLLMFLFITFFLPTTKNYPAGILLLLSDYADVCSILLTTIISFLLFGV